MAKMRQAKPDDGWRRSALPHTARSIEHFERHHGGGGSLNLSSDDLHTKLVNHGETRYALQAMDSTDGWSEWSLHRQVGPDIDDPDHWERIGAPKEAQPFCDCIGDGSTGQHDLNFPLGVDDGLAGHAIGSPGDPAGLKAAKAEAERAFKEYTADRGQGRNLGDYDINQIMRDEGF